MASSELIEKISRSNLTILDTLDKLTQQAVEQIKKIAYESDQAALTPQKYYAEHPEVREAELKLQAAYKSLDRSKRHLRSVKSNILRHDDDMAAVAENPD